MNGKVRRFYEELAAMSGLRLDPRGRCPVRHLQGVWRSSPGPCMRLPIES